MAEGMGSLASGFLAGFQTMNDYQRGQKADARADKEMSLREAQGQRDADYKKWTMDRTVERDKVGDQQWKETFTETQKNNADTRKRQWAQLSLQEQQEKRLADQARRTRERQEEADFLQRNSHIIQGSWDPALAPELYANEETAAILNDPRAKPLTSMHFASKEGMAANQTIMSHLNSVVQMGANGELDGKSDQELYQIYNQPEVIEAANIEFSQELSRGVGDIDPETGKEITKKIFKGFTPGPSGDSVVPVMTVHYADGSAADQPATLNRSPDPDDPVKEIPVSRLIKHVGTRASLFHQLQQSGMMGAMPQKLGFTEGPDTKGLRTASVGLQKQMTRDLAAIDKAVAKQEMSEEQGIQAKQGITETYTQQGQGLRELYGAGNQGGGQPSGGKVKAYIKDLGSKNPRLAELLPMAAQSQDPAIQQEYRVALAADDEVAMFAVLQKVASQADALQENQATEQLQAILQREGGQAPNQEEVPQRRVNRSSFIPGGIPGLNSLAQ